MTIRLDVFRVPIVSKVSCPCSGENDDTVRPDEGDGRIRQAGDLPAKSAQNPPVSEKLPPVIGPPASGWPMIPLTDKRRWCWSRSPRRFYTRQWGMTALKRKTELASPARV